MLQLLELSFGKTLTLSNVKHVANTAKNLITECYLDDSRLEWRVKGGKVVFSFNGGYFVKAFKTERIYKLAVVNAPLASINEINSNFAYLNEL